MIRLWALEASKPFKLRLIRKFSNLTSLHSGHNRWSKIRHDKAKVDASVHKQRASIAQEICLASKENGPDPQYNPRLATVIAGAKKQGFPKTSIENAIARGQGVSPSGAPLTTLTLEAMIPPGVAVIIECQTDSKLRTLADLKHLIKETGGSLTPTNHNFERRGKIVLGNPRALTEEDIFDISVDAGATDIEVTDDGNIVVYTEPDQTVATMKKVATQLNLPTVRSEIIWDPKKDLAVDMDDTEILQDFLDRLHDNSSVQEVYTNAI